MQWRERPLSPSAKDQRRPIRWRKLETGKFEAGRDYASHQRPVSQGLSRLPGIGKKKVLHLVALGEIGAKRAVRQPDFSMRAFRPLHAQRTASVINPKLGRIDAVPMRPLTRFQQEVNACRQRSPSARRRLAPSLPVPSAFRVRLKVEKPDNVVGSAHAASLVGSGHAQQGIWILRRPFPPRFVRRHLHHGEVEMRG